VSLADGLGHSDMKILVGRDALHDGVGLAEGDIAYQGFFDHGDTLRWPDNGSDSSIRRHRRLTMTHVMGFAFSGITVFYGALCGGSVLA
jgi:hypothetical protein